MSMAPIPALHSFHHLIVLLLRLLQIFFLKASISFAEHDLQGFHHSSLNLILIFVVGVPGCRALNQILVGGHHSSGKRSLCLLVAVLGTCAGVPSRDCSASSVTPRVLWGAISP